MTWFHGPDPSLFAPSSGFLHLSGFIGAVAWLHLLTCPVRRTTFNFMTGLCAPMES
ncbi:hypothetical protein OHAE_3911 [Ochrobactrum soli]|uniref:Uncharacterized protein n=1 Tax=Ochrobactrum soli TaxID=2448455 RepID=A0A2P9HIP9_9HYPH|nr:hypothetical protein OHAE_3911 [[Ochrobactrum] soli]